MSNLKSIAQISKLFISILTLFAFTFTVYTSPAFAAAPPCDKNDPLGCPAAGLQQIEDTFSNFISVFVGFAFVVLLIVAIMAGFKYLTSGGEPKAVSAAHQTLMWALLGIFMMAVAWIILQLIHAITGVDVLHFNVKILCIPGIVGC